MEAKNKIKIDEKTLNEILQVEGADLGATRIIGLKKEISYRAPEVHPQDVVDALRYIKQRNLLEEGTRIVSSNRDITALYFDLDLESTREIGASSYLKLKVSKAGTEYKDTNSDLVYTFGDTEYTIAFFRPQISQKAI